ncbi:MAG TPA: hypothetical protein VMS17_02475 [Gemmataceae bacterium]|nr:hypothetical protein [Gemmataceae bacterium]
MAQMNNPQNKEGNRPESGTAFDRAKGAAAEALQKGKEAAAPMVERASETASQVGHKADDAAAAVGSGIKNFADRMRNAGPQEGFLGRASHTVADTIRGGGEYLEQEKLSGIMKDVTDVVRRNPVPAVLAGLAFGFLIGRLLRS